MDDQTIVAAIRQGKVEPYYQPIGASVGSNIFNKFEVLARLFVDNEMVNPGVFLRVAKSNDVYDQVTSQVIEKSLNYLSKHSSSIEFSINLTSDDILSKTAVNNIVNQIENHSIGSQIIFELSEQSFLTGDSSIENEVRSFMARMKRLGCKFALDDFGTGYSTFHPLIAFNFDFIKFDKVLIKDITQHPKRYFLLDLLCEFSSRVNLQTIAEFVEDEVEAQALSNLNVDYLQGYYFSSAKESISEFIV